MVYDTVPRGFLKFAAFMKEIGMISKVPSSIKELTVPLLGNSGD
jgi:NitT/TauT family transport system substrate-binding protein